MRQLRYFAIFFLTAFLGCQEDVVTPIQKGKLAGKVVSKSDGSPIFDAEITTTPATISVFSKPDGSFDFGEVAVGAYSLRAVKNGFFNDVETTTVERDDSVFVLFRLADDSSSNRLPSPAEPLFPSNFSVSQPRNLTLRWHEAVEKDAGDDLEYDVILWKSGSSDRDTVARRTADTTVFLNDLAYASVYFWQILTFDQAGEAVFGPVWQFETEPFPDNRIVFCRQVDGVFQLFSSNPAGTTTVQLTSGAGNHFRPRMNPGRTKIAFLSDAGLETHLFVMNRDGSGIEKVSPLPVAGFTKLDLDFCWSPDGARLLFPSQNRLYKINSDGSGLSLFADAPAGFSFIECDWNGPTQRIAARTTGAQVFNSEILLFDELGALKSKVVADSSGGMGGPVFSIDGQKLLFCRDAAGFDAIDGRQLDSRIFQKAFSNGVISPSALLKPAGTNDLDPRFSPDGSKIIFTNTNNDGISPRSIWAMSLDGTSRTKLFDDAEMVEWK